MLSVDILRYRKLLTLTLQMCYLSFVVDSFHFLNFFIFLTKLLFNHNLHDFADSTLSFCICTKHNAYSIGVSFLNTRLYLPNIQKQNMHLVGKRELFLIVSKVTF